MAEVAKNLTPEVMADIAKLISSSSASGSGDFGVNGWARLPNGLILQWGNSSPKKDAASDYRGHSWTVQGYDDWKRGDVFAQVFPIPFPNACFSILMTTRLIVESFYTPGVYYRPGLIGELDSVNSLSDYDFQLVDYDLSKFNYTIHDMDNSYTSVPTQMHFLAVGY
jgi:hypothetical protein